MGWTPTGNELVVDLWIIFTTLARRWYLTIPLLVGSIVGAFMVASSLADSYSATASVLIAAPNEQIVEVPLDEDDPDSETESIIVDTNPLVGGIGNTGLAAATIDIGLSDGRTVTELIELGLSDDYDVFPDQSDDAILVIEANADDPAIAIATVEFLVSRVDADLDALQDELGAPQDVRIDDQVITRPTEAQVTSTGKPRIIIGVSLAGVILTVLLVSAVDGFLTRGQGGPVAQTATVRNIDRSATGREERAPSEPETARQAQRARPVRQRDAKGRWAKAEQNGSDSSKSGKDKSRSTRATASSE